MSVATPDNYTEEQLVGWLKSYLDFGEIVNDDFPAKGASSWYPYGYSVISNLLNTASYLISKIAKFEEIVLPSFVHGEDFMKECRHIKDFSKRVYWSPLYKEDDLHVFTPTIEAQLGSLYQRWLGQGKNLPFKFFTIRGVGRYETGKTIPLWKERNVWPFFEGLTAHRSKLDFQKTIKQQVVFMKRFFKALGIPVLIIERPKINRRLGEYSEKRIEAITITRDKRVVILANIYDLGEIFSKVYDIHYTSKSNKKYAQISAIGLSGRVLATMLVVNGDSQGFILSTSLAPIWVAILPVYDKIEIAEETGNLEVILKKRGISAKIFPATLSLGERRKKIAAMGIPFSIEYGPNELKSDILQIKLRNTPTTVKSRLKNLDKTLFRLSHFTQKSLHKHALGQFKAVNRIANSRKDLIKFTKSEFLTRASFCNEPDCHLKACKLTSVELIGRDYNSSLHNKSKCILCKNPASQTLYFGIKWKGEK